MWSVSSPSRHLFPFLPFPSCSHPSPSRPSSFSLRHPLAATSKELSWAWSETPAPSEAGQAAYGPGQTSLSSGPIYFDLGTATSLCLRAGNPGTQLRGGVVPSSCTAMLEPGWSSSSSSAVLPTADAPHHELGAIEAALRSRQCSAGSRRRGCWKLLLVMAMHGCSTSTLQCQDSCGQPWIR